MQELNSITTNFALPKVRIRVSRESIIGGKSIIKTSEAEIDYEIPANDVVKIANGISKSVDFKGESK